MEKRDPRVDPKARDQVGDRFVSLIFQNNVKYRKRTAKGNYGTLRTCWITTWRDWAKDKEIFYVAD